MVMFFAPKARAFHDASMLGGKQTVVHGVQGSMHCLF